MHCRYTESRHEDRGLIGDKGGRVNEGARIFNITFSGRVNEGARIFNITFSVCVSWRQRQTDNGPRCAARILRRAQAAHRWTQCIVPTAWVLQWMHCCVLHSTRERWQRQRLIQRKNYD